MLEGSLGVGRQWPVEEELWLVLCLVLLLALALGALLEEVPL